MNWLKLNLSTTSISLGVTSIGPGVCSRKAVGTVPITGESWHHVEFRASRRLGCVSMVFTISEKAYDIPVRLSHVSRVGRRIHDADDDYERQQEGELDCTYSDRHWVLVDLFELRCIFLFLEPQPTHFTEVRREILTGIVTGFFLRKVTSARFATKHWLGTCSFPRAQQSNAAAVPPRLPFVPFPMYWANGGIAYFRLCVLSAAWSSAVKWTFAGTCSLTLSAATGGAAR